MSNQEYRLVMKNKMKNEQELINKIQTLLQQNKCDHVEWTKSKKDRVETFKFIVADIFCELSDHQILYVSFPFVKHTSSGCVVESDDMIMIKLTIPQMKMLSEELSRCLELQQSYSIDNLLKRIDRALQNE